MSKTTKMYHGTTNDVRVVSEFPKAQRSMNGHGFYLTSCFDVANHYGRVITFEVPNNWTCKLIRPINGSDIGGSELEYILDQQEADALVLDHAVSITY